MAHKVAVAGALSLIVGGLIAAGVYRTSRQSGSIDSIAVLPLDIQSKDPEADYISDGIAKSVNNSLSRLPGLKVIPSSVVLHYKGKSADFQKIGAGLGVQAVLSGRVVQRGDDLSINIELDDVRSGKQLWGQQYRRHVAELLFVQNDIAKEVSKRLRSHVSAADQSRLTLGSTTNPEAYQLYLKGRYFTEQFTREGFSKGIEALNQAVELDPDYALAHSTLAYNYINQEDWFIAPREAGPKARAEAKKAWRPWMRRTRWLISRWRSNRSGTSGIGWRPNASSRGPLSSIPTRAMATGTTPGILRRWAGWTRRRPRRRGAGDADPLGMLANFGPGSVLVFRRHGDKAIESLRGAINLDPNYGFDYCFLGRAYEQQGGCPKRLLRFKRA